MWKWCNASDVENTLKKTNALVLIAARQTRFEMLAAFLIFTVLLGFVMPVSAASSGTAHVATATSPTGPTGGSVTPPSSSTFASPNLHVALLGLSDVTAYIYTFLFQQKVAYQFVVQCENKEDKMLNMTVGYALEQLQLSEKKEIQVAANSTKNENFTVWLPIQQSDFQVLISLTFVNLLTNQNETISETRILHVDSMYHLIWAVVVTAIVISVSVALAITIAGWVGYKIKRGREGKIARMRDLWT
jgi:hypothetical protein